MITVIDEEARLITGEIVFEQPDGFSYILGYYPEAFASFHGTIHEMFDQMNPVGQLVKIVTHPETQSVVVSSRVLCGIESTWRKISDRVLSRYGISFVPDAEYGTDPKAWPKKEFEGKEYPYLPKYTIIGMSYVDNPLVVATGPCVE